jgi:hypothetical protein
MSLEKCFYRGAVVLMQQQIGRVRLPPQRSFPRRVIYESPSDKWPHGNKEIHLAKLLGSVESSRVQPSPAQSSPATSPAPRRGHSHFMIPRESRGDVGRQEMRIAKSYRPIIPCPTINVPAHGRADLSWNTLILASPRTSFAHGEIWRWRSSRWLVGAAGVGGEGCVCVCVCVCGAGGTTSPENTCLWRRRKCRGQYRAFPPGSRVGGKNKKRSLAGSRPWSDGGEGRIPRMVGVR